MQRARVENMVAGATKPASFGKPPRGAASMRSREAMSSCDWRERRKYPFDEAFGQGMQIRRARLILAVTRQKITRFLDKTRFWNASATQQEHIGAARFSQGDAQPGRLVLRLDQVAPRVIGENT